MKQDDPHSILLNQIEYLKQRKNLELYLLKDDFHRISTSNLSSSILKTGAKSLLGNIDYKNLILLTGLRLVGNKIPPIANDDPIRSVLKISAEIALDFASSKLRNSNFGKRNKTLIDSILSFLPIVHTK